MKNKEIYKQNLIKSYGFITDSAKNIDLNIILYLNIDRKKIIKEINKLIKKEYFHIWVTNFSRNPRMYIVRTGPTLSNICEVCN